MTRVFAVQGADRLGESEFSFFREIASGPRKARTARFLRREDACRSLVAEALLRHALAADAGLDLDGCSLRLGEHGKPWLPGSGIHFNLSHSGEWVICGIDAGEIGVDIEAHHPVDPGLPERFFTAAEKAWLEEAAPGDPARRRFFDVWALKESYIKAIGKGLSCPLDAFTCIPAGRGGGASLQRADPDLPQRHLRLMDIHPCYSCALCTLDGGIPPIISLFGPGELAEALHIRKNRGGQKLR